MSIFRTIITHKSLRIAAAGAVVALVVMIVAWQAGFDRAALKSLWIESEAFVRARPWALFLAIVVLPGLPFPVSALLLVAGIVWREHPLGACLFSLAALSLNMTWTYWVAAHPGRRLIERLIRLTALRLPDLSQQDHLGMILVMRLTPGIPLFFQNYLLGFLRAPFRLYLPLSIVLTGLMSSGIVLAGAGASDGRFAVTLTGIALVVVAIILTRWFRAWLEKRKAAAAADSAAGV